MTDQAYMMEYRPPLAERIWRWFGFRRAFQPRPEETTELPSYMVTNVRVRIGLADRLRILVAGKLDVEIVTQTDVAVHHAVSQSAVGVPRP